MNEKAVVALLQTICADKYVGFVNFDILAFAEANHLIDRTEDGNFKITDKGLNYLDTKTISTPIKK